MNINNILLSFLFFPVCILAEMPKEGIQLNSLEEATTQQREEILEAVSQNQALSIENTPEGKWLIYPAGKDYLKMLNDLSQALTIINMFNLDVDYESTINEWSEFDQETEEAARARHIELGKLLAGLVRAHPKDEEIYKAAASHVAFLKKQYVNKLFGTKGIANRELAQAIDDIEEMVFAVGLGFDPDVFTRYPELQDFIRDSNLHKQAKLHKHIYGMNKDNIPFLLYEGAMVPWTDLEGKLQAKNGQIKDHYYTHQGIVRGDPTQEIRPFKQDNPADWGNQYILELVSYANHSLMIPHVWVRLKNKQGDIYSVGFHSTDSLAKSWMNTIFPDVAAGKVFSPDPKEGDIHWDSLLSVTPIAISEKQFFQVMDYLKDYQKDPDRCFPGQSSLGTTGCVSFVRVLLDELNIPGPKGGWVLNADNPYNFQIWQNQVRLEREKKIRELSAKDASQEELNQVRYSMPN